MNYLQLVNDFVMESSLCAPLVSVTNRINNELKAVTWVRDAWLEIQRMRLWNFMFTEGSYLIGTNDKFSPSDFNEEADLTYVPSSFQVNYSGTPSSLTKKSFNELRSLQRTNPKTGRPSYYAISPAKEIVIYPASDDANCLIYFDYYGSPKSLSVAEDSPSLPSAYHKMIVYKALEFYAEDEGGDAVTLYQQKKRSFGTMYDRLILKQTGGIDE